MLTMDYELELTKTNRLLLARAFRNNKRVDYSIDCVLEGQMGKAFVDDLAHPAAYRITIGPFWYFAGDARGAGRYQMMENFPAYNLLMPSSGDWLEVAKEIFGGHLQSFPRYSFSSAGLSAQHLEGILSQSPFRERLMPLSVDLAGILSQQPDSYLEISDFDSPQDFIDRSLGFTVLDGEKVMGVAYSSLVCSRGIEVSLFVEENYRRQGVATAMAGKLLLACLEQGLRPNWDAANPESCKLAEKLGYELVDTYESYYHNLKR
jgi:GNAT superfamily N-acetyltransferase